MGHKTGLFLERNDRSATSCTLCVEAHSLCKKSDRSRNDCAHFLLVNLATEYNAEFKNKHLINNSIAG